MAWFKLLHANTQGVSEAKGDFFLHPDGAKNAEIELIEFIKVLQTASPELGDKHPLCRFPARAMWLSEHYPSFSIPAVTCSHWKTYQGRVSAQSAAVVFSSYYVSNPASSFGHTFLRLGKATPQGDESPSLLDVGVSYGAITNGAGPISYVVGGLNGAFDGKVTAIPYYYKVREYNDYETRDLWNYHLKLSTSEVARLTAHAYELESAGFPYYFLSANCSLFVLRMIEAARPGLELTRHLPFYVIPSDTLRALIKEDIVERVSFRPSARSRFHYLVKKLDASELNQFDKLIVNPAASLTLSDERKALLLDTALAHRDVVDAKEILREEPAALARKRPILMARAQVPVKSEPLLFNPAHDKLPHSGHGSKRLSLWHSKGKSSEEQILEMRFAFHDLLDPSGGYPEQTAITVGKLQLRRRDNERWDVPLVQFLDIVSLRPFERYQWAPSWKMDLGLKQIHDTDALGMSAAMGGAFQFKTLTFAVMAGADTHYLPATPDRGRAALGPEAMLLWEITERLKVLSTWRLRFSPWREQVTRHEIRFAPKDSWAMGAHLETHEGDLRTRYGASLFYYF